jgi:protein phosphatase
MFVLCSDGLTEVVSNNTIGFVLNQNGSPQKTAEKLVELANANGGPDNISVVVAKVFPRQSHSTVKASESNFSSD